MKAAYRLVPVLLVALLGWVTPASAQAPAPSAPAQAAPAPSGPVYAVTYFDVAPAAARKAAGVLRQYQTATRKAEGNVELTVLHQVGRSGRFAIVEGWKDKTALDAHADAVKALGEKLQGAMLTPFDSRQFVPMAVGKPGTGGIYVLTHVDVFPNHKDEAAGLVKSLVEASRGDPGVDRFDALIWDGHPNHFHLIAAFDDKKAEEAHAAADHTKEFRAKVQPFEGAFFDERVYEPIKEGKDKEAK